MQQGSGGYLPPSPGISPGRKLTKEEKIIIWIGIHFLEGGRGYLRIVAPDMADGDYVEINCEGASPDEEGSIQWYFNNRVRIYFSLISNRLTKEFEVVYLNWFLFLIFTVNWSTGKFYTSLGSSDKSRYLSQIFISFYPFFSGI